MSKPILASDQKCICCKKQAVVFWPVCDPDIQSKPYCRKCLDETKMRLIQEIMGTDTRTTIIDPFPKRREK